MTRISVAFLAICSGGCAAVTAIQIDAPSPQLRQRIVDEMQIVIPHIKPEHLQRCREILEETDWLGAKYQVAGEFQPSVQHSCAAQMRDGLLHLETEYKVVAYAVRMVKVAGIYGTGSPVEVRACAFKMKVGDPQVSVYGSRTGARADSNCHAI